MKACVFQLGCVRVFSIFIRAIPALPEVVRPAALGSRPQLDLSPVSPAEFSNGNDGHMGVQPCYGGGKVHTVVCL